MMCTLIIILLIAAMPSFCTELSSAADTIRNGNTDMGRVFIATYIEANPASPATNDAIIAFNLLGSGGVEAGSDGSAYVASYLSALDAYLDGQQLTATAAFLDVAEGKDAPPSIRAASYIWLAELSPPEEKPIYLEIVWNSDWEEFRKRAAYYLIEHYIAMKDREAADEFVTEYSKSYPGDESLSYWLTENFSD